MPFEVPESWEWCELDDVCAKIYAGGDKPSVCSKYATSECNVPIFSNGIENSGLYGYTDKPIELTPSITISARGTIGYTCCRTIPFVPIIRLITIVPIPKLVLLQYIKYALDSLMIKSEGSSIPQLTVPNVKPIQIPIPPIKEQERIVIEIKKMFALIETLETAKEDLQTSIVQAKSKILELAIHGKLVPQDPNDEPAIELLKRINPKLVPCDNAQYENIPFGIPDSWEWVTLGSISNYGQCKNIDVSNIPPNAWVLELEDIEKDSANIVQHLSCKEREINGVRHSFQKGNVLYSKLRTYLNKVLVAPEDGYCTTEIVPIAFPESIMPNYINHVLRSNLFLNYASQCVYGVKMPRLSTSDACKGLIPLPPYKEQLRIVAKIEELFGVFDNITKSLES